MAEYRQLAHPPLREAVIDLRLAQELADSVIKETESLRLVGFEAPAPMWRGQMTFQFGPKGSPDTNKSNEAYGWRYTTEDGSRVVQFRKNGFTYSTIRGYTTWTNAREAAQTLWRPYCRAWKPGDVARLAVRYINVLDIPQGADFDLYLTAGPRVPLGAPNRVGSFVHRVLIPFSDDGTVLATITQATEQTKGTVTPVVLDIDVWRDYRYQADSPEIWTTLDELRRIKNLLFFGSVTDKALESYQ